MDCRLSGYSLTGFPGQEYWSMLPFPPPGNLPAPGIEPTSSASPTLVTGFFTTESAGKPMSSIKHRKARLVLCWAEGDQV